MKDMPMADGRPRPASEAVPFREVYIHALVRDAERQKMSKTKGNVVDPIDITEKYGTDAVRFTLASMASPGTDIAFNEDRIAGYRNFANKIWNAARFMFMNVDKAAEAGAWQAENLAKMVEQHADSTSSDLLDGWIDARFQQTAWEINQALAAYRFDEAANLVYQFFWGDLCDVYIEAVKLRLDFSGPEKPSARQALAHLVRIFEGSLRLLSPFMPFLTEEIWHALYEQKAPAKSIALTQFPLGAELNQQQKGIIEQVRVLRELLSDIRNRRAELQVEPKQKVPVRVFTTESAVRKLVEANRDFLERQAMIETIAFADESMSKVAGVQTRNAYEVAIVYEKKIDVAAERDRLVKELKRFESEHDRAQSQLANESFLAKAPAHVVEGLRRRLTELEQLIVKTRAALEALEKGGARSNGRHG